ncbi:hypothetical protein BpHYR1_054590, partial [Brachionus plicatilis]
KKCIHEIKILPIEKISGSILAKVEFIRRFPHSCHLIHSSGFIIFLLTQDLMIYATFKMNYLIIVIKEEVSVKLQY